MLARRWNRDDRASAFYTGLLLASILAIAGGAALLAGPWVTELDPTSHVYPATVWILVIWTTSQVLIGVIMQLYCIARRVAGRMTARCDIDIQNVALYWHFTAFTAVQGMFLLSALLLWLSAYGGNNGHDARRAAGVVGLLLTSIHMTLLGALLALAPRALYVHARGFGGLTPLADQDLGGAIMLLIGGVAYLLGGLGLMAGLLKRKEAGINRAGLKSYRSQA